MSDIKSWLAVAVAVGASLVLNGCAGMSKNQAALVGALSCGIPAAAAGGFVSHNNEPNHHIPCGGRRSYRPSERRIDLWRSSVRTDSGTQTTAFATASSTTTAAASSEAGTTATTAATTTSPATSATGAEG